MEPLVGAVGVELDAHDGVNARYTVTFRSTAGDIESLEVVSAAGATEVGVTEFVRGFQNHFTIQPRKASGDAVRDVTIDEVYRGQDVFFTEIWTSDASVVDGTHEWLSDAGVAAYEPQVLELFGAHSHSHSQRLELACPTLLASTWLV